MGSFLSSESPVSVRSSSSAPPPPNTHPVTTTNLHAQAQAGIPRGPNSTQVTNTQNSESGGSENLLRRGIWETIEEQELGKHLMGLAAAVVTAIAVSSNSLSVTAEMRAAALTAWCAVVVMWNSLLLRRTYPEVSRIILVLGFALTMLALTLLSGAYLPRGLKILPWLCFIASLFSFFLTVFTHRRPTVNSEDVDVEGGERTTTRRREG